MNINCVRVAFVVSLPEIVTEPFTSSPCTIPNAISFIVASVASKPRPFIVSDSASDDIVALLSMTVGFAGKSKELLMATVPTDQVDDTVTTDFKATFAPFNGDNASNLTTRRDIVLSETTPLTSGPTDTENVITFSVAFVASNPVPKRVK